MKKLLILLCVVTLFPLGGCEFSTFEDGFEVKTTPAPTSSVEKIDDFLLQYINNKNVADDIYIVVSSNSKGYGTGVVDLSVKKEIIPTDYDEIEYGYDEKGELKFLTKSGKEFSIYDKSGSLVKNIGEFKEVYLIDNNFASINAVTKDGYHKILDSRGEILFGGDNYTYLKYDSVSGNYIVEKDDKYGVVSTSGQILVQFEYSLIAQGAAPNEYIAKKNGGYGIIDSKNNVLTDFHYTKLTPVSSDDNADKTGTYSARRMDKKRGIITAKDEIVKDFE